MPQKRSGRWPVAEPTGTSTFGFRIIAWLAILNAKICAWRFRYEGLEHVPATGGAVLAWNHNGHVDFIATAMPIYQHLRRQVRVMSMRELWDHPRFGWAPRFANAVPVDRESASGRNGALRDAAAAVRGGDIVMMAPETKISRSFELLPFRTGAARLAQETGVPLIPSISWGTHRLTTSDHGFNPFRAFRIPVEIRFGAPIHVGPDDDVLAATEQLRRSMLAMLDEVQASYPLPDDPSTAWWWPARLGGGAPTIDEVEQARQDKLGNT